MSSPTATGSAAYGHRLHPRQDVSGLVGCFCRRRRLRRRGADGTRGHGGGRHPANPLLAEAAVDRSGAAQGDHGDLVLSNRALTVKTILAKPLYAITAVARTGRG